jgi:hypothetical protein
MFENEVGVGPPAALLRPTIRASAIAIGMPVWLDVYSVPWSIITTAALNKTNKRPANGTEIYVTLFNVRTC